MIAVLLIVGAVTLLYLYLKWNYSYWKRNKVPGPDPTYFVGNIGPTLNLKTNFGVMATEWYK